jgi:hypothetical protein
MQKKRDITLPYKSDLRWGPGSPRVKRLGDEFDPLNVVLRVGMHGDMSVALNTPYGMVFNSRGRFICFLLPVFLELGVFLR